MIFAEIKSGTTGELDKIAAALAARGFFEEGVGHQERLLTLHTQAFGEVSPEAATTLFNLGKLLQLQGCDGEAWPYLERVLAVRKKVLGEYHSSTELVRENLAVLDT